MQNHKKLLLGATLVACTSGVEQDIAFDSTSNLISFSPMYSAFDGEHEYALTPNVPSAAPSSNDADPILASSIQWHLDDAFVKRDEFPDLPAAIKLTTKKDGVTTVAMTAKSLSGRELRSAAKLTISRAQLAEWDIGELTYNNNVKSPSMRPEGACGGVQLSDSSACGNCHHTLGLSIQYTPTQTAGYSDDDLIQIFTRAAKPAGGTFDSLFLRAASMPDCIYEAFHTWEMTDAEKKGIVWKLRSIPPMVTSEQDLRR